MKKAAVVLFCVMCSVGCASIRMSARYENGVLRDDQIMGKPCRKFYLRSYKVKDWFSDGPEVSEINRWQLETIMNPNSVRRQMPEWIGASVGENNIPLDIEITINQPEVSGEWTMLLCLTCVLPMSIEHEYVVDVDIFVGFERMRLPLGKFNLHTSHRGAFLSPLGCIPFSKSEGYQLSDSFSGVLTDFSKKQTEFWVKAVVECIVRQLKEHSFERLLTPDVNFNEVE